jgi:hypothetical protein
MRMMGVQTACVLVMVAASGGLLRGEEQILIKNAGFEAAGQNSLPADWWGPTGVYQRDTAVFRSGGASLRFTNSDPKSYVLCSQSIRLEAGKMYEISAWVRTRGIKGEDSGATICVEWSDEQGKYLGGAYPQGRKGDTDWTFIKGLTSRVPENAKRFSLSCYVRQGMTGTAWWDDVSIQRARENPLSTVVMVPNYRGEITDAGPEHVKIRAELNLVDYDMQPKDVALAWSVVSDGERGQVPSTQRPPVTQGKPGDAARSGQAPTKEPVPFGIEVARGIRNDVAGTQTDLLIPTRDLPMGSHRIEIMLTRKVGTQLLGSESRRIVRVPTRSDRTTYIDQHNRLIFQGKPFFPLGTYWGSISKDEIGIYADSPFNCLMPYGQPTMEQMDLAHKHGLKVIYTVKDIYHGTDGCPGGIKTDADERAHIKGKVEQFGKHPALLAWYLNDELGVEMMPRLVGHQHWLEELDPHHPTWVVLYQVDQIRKYIESFDVIGTDPYPIPSRPAAMAGEWTRKTVAGVCGVRPVWMVPQVFNWACYSKTDAEKKSHRPPTCEEMRCMAWQCIAEGATGLIFYSWFDIRRDRARPFAEHWPLVKKVAQEIKDMIPVLLSVEPAPTIRGEPAPWLNWLVKQAGDKTYLIAVNNSTEPRLARFVLPSKPVRIMLRGSDEPPVVGPDNALEVRLKALDVRICELTGLST